MIMFFSRDLAHNTSMMVKCRSKPLGQDVVLGLLRDDDGLTSTSGSGSASPSNGHILVRAGPLKPGSEQWAQ